MREHQGVFGKIKHVAAEVVEHGVFELVEAACDVNCAPTVIIARGLRTVMDKDKTSNDVYEVVKNSSRSSLMFHAFLYGAVTGGPAGAVVGLASMYIFASAVTPVYGLVGYGVAKIVKQD